MSDKDVITQVKKRFTLSQEYTQPYFDRFLDNYKHYFIHTIDEAVDEDPANYPFYFQLMLPISYQIVETILPRMFTRLPDFSIKTEEENDEQAELALKELIRYQLKHPYLLDNPPFARMVDFVKECFITGNAVGYVPWVKKTRKVKEWQPYSLQMGLEPSWDNMPAIRENGLKPDWKQVEVERVVIDDPVFEYDSIFHFFPDPKKKSLSSMGWVIRQRWATLDELMEEANASPRDYKNIDKLKEMKRMKQYGTTDVKNYDEELAGIFSSQDYKLKDETEGQFEVLEMREQDKLTIVVNRKLVIRRSENPYHDGTLGVVFMKDTRIPNEFYGWGEVDPIKKIEDMMSDVTNMRLDGVIRSLLRMWKVNPNGLVDGEEFIPEPDTVVQVTDMNAIQPLDVGENASSSYKEMAEWFIILQNITGVTDYTTGQSKPSMNKTLGGVELLQQAANARFKFKLQMFEQTALAQIGSYYVSRNLQFFNRKQGVNTQEGKMVITPDQIRQLRGNIHFVVDSGSTMAVNKQAEVARWQDILNRVAKGQPPFHNLSENAIELIGRKYLNSLEFSPSNSEQMLERRENVQVGTEGQTGLQPAIPQTLGQTSGGSNPQGPEAGAANKTARMEGLPELP